MFMDANWLHKQKYGYWDHYRFCMAKKVTRKACRSKCEKDYSFVVPVSWPPSYTATCSDEIFVYIPE